MKIFPLFFLIVLLLLSSCWQLQQEEEHPFAFNETDSIKAAEFYIGKYFDDDVADTILVNAVTFIGRKPVVATSESRFNQEFRQHYIDNSKGFDFFLYHINPDSLHSFFMIRPARSVHGNLRGVLGNYRLNPDNTMYDFIEILNTHIKSREELQKIGLILFEELISKGHVHELIGDTAMVEWPDDRLKYDKVRNEWRYDVE